MTRPRINLKPPIEQRVKIKTSGGGTGQDHIPTDYQRWQVRQMSAFGIPQELMAPIIGIHRETLAKKYADELLTGGALATFKVAQRLFDVATKSQGREAITAMIFWLKTRGGWKENTQVEMTGANGGPIETVGAVQLTDEERFVRFIQLLNAKRAAGAGQITE